MMSQDTQCERYAYVYVADHEDHVSPLPRVAGGGEECKYIRWRSLNAVKWFLTFTRREPLGGFSKQRCTGHIELRAPLVLDKDAHPTLR